MWLQERREPAELMQLLYDLEVIGVETVGLKKEKSNAVWENYTYSYQRAKAKVDRSLTFLVHPALWKSLELAI